MFYLVNPTKTCNRKLYRISKCSVLDTQSNFLPNKFTKNVLVYPFYSRAFVFILNLPIHRNLHYNPKQKKI